MAKEIPLMELVTITRLALDVEKDYAQPTAQKQAKAIATKSLSLIAQKIGLKK